MLPRLRSLVAGLCALLLLGAAAPALDASDPATSLAQAKAARERGERAQAKAQLERLVDEFDGTPEAAVAALQLLELLVERWLDRSASIEETIAAADELGRRSRALLRSRSYRRPEAAELRQRAYFFAAQAVALPWKWTGSVEARRERDRRCGEDYLAILADLPPDDANVPDALFSAGNCFLSAERWIEAEPLLRRVLAEHPRHRAAPFALQQLARGSLAVARFEDAAAYSEQYARLNPRSHTAAELLSIASTIRRGLGHDAQAAEDVRTFEADARPHQAAAFSRARGEWPGDDDERIAHLERHLARHGAALELHQRLADELTLAQLQWRKSCAWAVGGLCSRLGRRPGADFFMVPVDKRRQEPVRYAQAARGAREPYRPPPQCSAWPLSARVVVTARDPALVRAAQRRFRSVHKAARRRLADPSLDPAARAVFAELAAGSAIGLADHRFEHLVAIERPRDLVLADQASQRRFDGWLKRTDAVADALASTYADIADAAPPGPAKIAALARLGQLAEARGDLLYAAPLPLLAASRPEVEAYCDRARARAEPLYVRAVEAYTRCLAVSAEAGMFTELSSHCEDARAFRDARRWPPQEELLGAPTVSALREPEVIGVQLGG